MAQFHINAILPHKVDQCLNVLQTYFYASSLWYLMWRHKKVANNLIIHNSQFKLIRNWLIIFTCLISVITLDFTLAMANMWIYDDKSIFLNRASFAILLAAVIYVSMNMIVMFFPNIMYGLPFDHENKLAAKASPAGIAPHSKDDLVEKPAVIVIQKPRSRIGEPQLFSDKYMANIEGLIQQSIGEQTYLQPNFNLTQISIELSLPVHHLTYYFNNICDTTFSDWRNKHRIAFVLNILSQENANQLTLEAIGLQAGFTSNSTFIRSFKKVTGKTPSDYWESIR